MSKKNNNSTASGLATVWQQKPLDAHVDQILDIATAYGLPTDWVKDDETIKEMVAQALSDNPREKEIGFIRVLVQLCRLIRDEIQSHGVPIQFQDAVFINVEHRLLAELQKWEPERSSLSNFVTRFIIPGAISSNEEEELGMTTHENRTRSALKAAQEAIIARGDSLTESAIADQMTADTHKKVSVNTVRALLAVSNTPISLDDEDTAQCPAPGNMQKMFEDTEAGGRIRRTIYSLNPLQAEVFMLKTGCYVGLRVGAQPDSKGEYRDEDIILDYSDKKDGMSFLQVAEILNKNNPSLHFAPSDVESIFNRALEHLAAEYNAQTQAHRAETVALTELIHVEDEYQEDDDELEKYDWWNDADIFGKSSSDLF